ncbi:hypothetical protein BpHYR1_001902 [Brachionus plicatilis]|uniref:Uncharacterized protein n=1 Tax=Brachionus plicatilis TaxID=10195 RepID=A0A3M7SJD1_BRAPC|nr:hypothetical protein BpHYR1_001902 [Brachionus plicatilis]
MLHEIKARTGLVASKNVNRSNLYERLKEMLNGYSKENFESFFENKCVSYKLKFTIRLCFYLQEKIATYGYLISILFTCTANMKRCSSSVQKTNK